MKFQLINCSFINNTAAYGGAIFILHHLLKIDNLTMFKDNYANFYGNTVAYTPAFLELNNGSYKDFLKIYNVSQDKNATTILQSPEEFVKKIEGITTFKNLQVDQFNLYNVSSGGKCLPFNLVGLDIFYQRVRLDNNDDIHVKFEEPASGYCNDCRLEGKI